MGGQLDLFSCTDQLPIELFNFSDESWENLLASEELDNRFPVEKIEEGKNSTGGWSICLRQIENGVFLWGADVYNKRKQHGNGFYPFRKWGPERAAMSRESAIESAKAYIANFFDK